MSTRTHILLAAAAAIAIAPVQRAAADTHGLVGAIIGGAIVGAAINNANKNKPNPVVRSGVPTATRAENRETQTALNYFGFDAGTPDGVLGRRSRAATSAYQAYMGFPVTGTLTEFERDILIASYHRGLAGGAETNQLIAGDPDGTRALLVAQRDTVTGGGSSPDGGDGTSTEEDGALPLFAATPIPSVPTDEHCARPENLPDLGGGPIQVKGGPDAMLGKQLCLARAGAIEAGDGAAMAIPGMTLAQVDASCAQYGPALSGFVSALPTKGRDALIQEVSAFVDQSGMDAAQLATTARICLASGYRVNDMDIALGSALLLVALGEAPFAEIPGHHLSQGVGTAQSTERALEWYDLALTSLQNGTPEVILPGYAGRVQAVQAAVSELGGASPVTPRPVEASARKTPKLPTLGD